MFQPRPSSTTLKSKSNNLDKSASSEDVAGNENEVEKKQPQPLSQLNQINSTNSSLSTTSFKLEKLPNLEKLRSSCTYDVDTLIFCLYGLEQQRDSLLQHANASPGDNNAKLIENSKSTLTLERTFKFIKFPEDKYDEYDSKYGRYNKKSDNTKSDNCHTSDDKKTNNSNNRIDKQLVHFNFSAPASSPSLVTSAINNNSNANSNATSLNLKYSLNLARAENSTPAAATFDNNSLIDVSSDAHNDLTASSSHHINNNIEEVDHDKISLDNKLKNMSLIKGNNNSRKSKSTNKLLLDSVSTIANIYEKDSTKGSSLKGSEKAVKGPIPNLKSSASPNVLNYIKADELDTSMKIQPELAQERSFLERVLGKNLEENDNFVSPGIVDKPLGVNVRKDCPPYQQFPQIPQLSQLRQTIPNMHSFPMPRPQAIHPIAQKAHSPQIKHNMNGKELSWQYKDPSGGIQGPFTSRQMHEWWENNFFPPNLLVRYNTNMAWTSYRILYPAPNVPFLMPPRKYITKPCIGNPASLTDRNMDEVTEEALNITREMRLLLNSTEHLSDPHNNAIGSNRWDRNKSKMASEDIKTISKNNSKITSDRLETAENFLYQMSENPSVRSAYVNHLNVNNVNLEKINEIAMFNNDHNYHNFNSSTSQVGWTTEKPKAEPLAEIMAKQANETSCVSTKNPPVTAAKNITNSMGSLGEGRKGWSLTNISLSPAPEFPSLLSDNNANKGATYSGDDNTSSGNIWARAVGGKVWGSSEKLMTPKRVSSDPKNFWGTPRSNGVPLANWIKEDNMDKSKQQNSTTEDGKSIPPLEFNRILEEWQIKIDPCLLGILFSLKNEANILIFLKHAAKGSADRHPAFAAYLNQLREKYPSEWAQMLQETTLKSSKASLQNSKG